MRTVSKVYALAALVALLVAATLAAPAVGLAAEAPVPLGKSLTYAILAGSSIVNSGTTTIDGDAGKDVGVSPGSTITGQDGLSGATVVSTATAAEAQVDLVAAFEDAAGRTGASSISPQLGDTTLKPGVYTSDDGSFEVSGAVTLDAEGDPNAVFIFQATDSLITQPGSFVILTNGARYSQVFWQVGSTASLGADSQFEGHILAQGSIGASSGATIEGQLLSIDGDVVADSDTITNGLSAIPPPTINIEIAASPPLLDAPGSVTYTYTVTNPGDVPLTGVTVTDDKVSGITLSSGDDNSDNILTTNETWLYTGTLALTATTTNVATAKATAGTTDVSGTASLTVEVGAAAETTHTTTGGAIPETATPLYDILGGGAVLALVGAMGYWVSSRRTHG